MSSNKHRAPKWIEARFEAKGNSRGHYWMSYKKVLCYLCFLLCKLNPFESHPLRRCAFA
jgi:hypothetical protein